MTWGRQDPHIPHEGRERTHAALEDAGTRFSWVEVNSHYLADHPTVTTEPATGRPMDPGESPASPAEAAAPVGQPTLDELAEFAPRWAIFWAGSVVPSQFAIWRPYLARSRYRWLVIGRSGPPRADVLAAIAAMPNVRLAIVDDASIRAFKQLPSFTGFCYVLGFKTATFANINTFRNHAHVWVSHGESDKLAAAPRSASIYDSIFIARYRGLSRFPRAIRPWVSRNACAIGAPMVEGLEPDPWTKPRPIRTILYAPTWEGYSDSTNYSSLDEAGRQLAASLPELTKRGIKLIIRPHPKFGAGRIVDRSGVERIVAAGAILGQDKLADFRAADLMISDISGVTAEWLLTEKPSIIPTSDRLTGIGRSPSRIEREYPWMYQWDSAREDLSTLLDRIQTEDPLRSARRSASRSMYRGHRSLDEASETLDLALSALHFRKMRIPVRWAFEVLRVPGMGTVRNLIRGVRSAVAGRRSRRTRRRASRPSG
jgi:CDP-Glycerol:Poly(glycerophosphate) glycerophosphotransferase